MRGEERSGLTLGTALLGRGAGCIRSLRRCSTAFLLRTLRPVRTHPLHYGSRASSRASFPQLAQQHVEPSHPVM